MLRLFYTYFCMTCLCVLSLCVPSLSSSLNAATLHSIIVANTMDWEIGLAARSDFKRFQHESLRIAEATGLYLTLYEFRGMDYRAQSIMECIQSLDLSPDDVILYFHSSHGLRTHSMAFDPFPILDFGARDALYLRDVVNLIEEKSPRLSVVVADCCNPWVPDVLRPAMLEVHTKADNRSIRQLQYEQYQRLFLVPRGNIILLGSKPGGQAYANSLYGSFCTFYWTHLLDRLSKTEEPLTWTNLLHSTQEKIESVTHFPFHNAPKPQNVWYSIQLDTEEPFSSPNLMEDIQ